MQVTDTPTGTGYVAIAGGWQHSLALKADGSIVSWGRDSERQVMNTPTRDGHIAVAAGGRHSLALATYDPISEPNVLGPLGFALVVTAKRRRTG